MNPRALALLEHAFPGQLKKQVDLTNKSTLRTGGTAAYFLSFSELGEIETVFDIWKKEKFSFFFLGRGSNCLFPDEPIDGLVLQADSSQHAFRIEKEWVVVDGTVYLPQAIKLAHEHGLMGLEFAAGIPGTIGGSVKMNAGTKNGELSSVLKWVKVVSPRGVEKFKREELGFSYRESHLPKDAFVLEAALALQAGEEAEIKDAKASLNHYLSYRNRTQPLNMPTLGSTFVNPPGDHAARLIESCGLKGFSVKGIEVSKKHANFLVNTGKGTAKDVLEIIAKVKERVEGETGIKLKTEICELGFDGKNPVENIA